MYVYIYKLCFYILFIFCLHCLYFDADAAKRPGTSDRLLYVDCQTLMQKWITVLTFCCFPCLLCYIIAYMLFTESDQGDAWARGDEFISRREGAAMPVYIPVFLSVPVSCYTSVSQCTSVSQGCYTSISQCTSVVLHPVRNPRFASFRTQPLENLSAAVKLPINKKVSGQPNPWNKSWTANSCYANWVYTKSV